MRYTCLPVPVRCGCLLFFSLSSFAQMLAFPTAEGAGKFTTGGRRLASGAAKNFEVSSLVDGASSATTPGTFRHACTNNCPSAPNRIIVFRVSVTIHLYAALPFNKTNTTIAGQTALGEDICIADYPVTIGANKMIIRYLRFRLGDKNQDKGKVNPSGAGDGFGDNGSGRQNIIVDHCTSSWNDDEALTIYKGDNVTVQCCLVGEPLNYSYHMESGDADYEQHAYGRYYLMENYCDNNPVIAADDWKGFAFNWGRFADSTASKVDVPFAAVDINTQSAQEAYGSVLAKAGCALPHRDTLDSRIVAGVMNRAGRVIDRTRRRCPQKFICLFTAING